MDTVRETDQISCSWCGGYSAADATCEFCGSPLAAVASGSRINDGVTVLAEEELPVQPLPSPPIERAPVLSLPEPLLVQAASRPEGLQVEAPRIPVGVSVAGPSPEGLGRTRWIRYRRSLQVRWLIEAVTS